MNQQLFQTNKSFDDSGAQYAWDSTSLKSAEECPRKYYYKHICGYYREEKSYHLLFGGWYATALEHFYKHLASGVDREEALEAVVLEALVNTWEGREFEETPGPDNNRYLKAVENTGRPWQSPTVPRRGKT